MRLDERLLLAYVAIVSILRFSLEWQGFKLPPADFLFVVVAVAHLALIVARRRAMRWSAFHPFAGLYLGAMLVSAVLSDAPRHSLLKWAGECYLVAIAVIVFNIVVGEASLRRITFAWLIGAAINVVAALAAIIAFYAHAPRVARIAGTAGFGSLPAGAYPRVSGLFAYPNMACTFYAITVVMIMMAADRGWLRRGTATALAAATSFAALFTFSPALGGLVLAPCVVAWIDRRARAAYAFGIVVAALAILATLPEPAALLQRHSLEPSSRVVIWRQAIDRALQHPLFGRGIGSEAVDVVYIAPSGGVHRLTDAHNSILNLACEGGLVTAAAFVALVVYLLRGIPWPRRAAMFLGVAFICGFLYADLTGSFEDTRHEWVLIGMLLSASALVDLPNPRQVISESQHEQHAEP